ncbi:unnamed protein product [Caenorhabditis auriculariae]|uniref:Uncharacterized protein n=1 Tax=Caenorhabditis auriculariae TaxID=2777116 RepID=A0A8S1H165_9PELO|nr:unnamed protein product [Caenorhabditis auriculariae]
MSGTITIKMHDKEVEFDLTENKITFISIKSACLLTNEAIVSLSYELNGRRKFCQSQVVPEPCFVLPAGWPTMQFNVESIEYHHDHQRLLIKPNPEQLPIDGDLAAYVGRFALYYNVKGDNYKRCAVPLTPRLAATCRHGENIAIKEGTSGSFKGDSGGGCWDVDGRLIGMQIAVEKVPHTRDNGRPASPAVGGRCLIVPVIAIEAIIRDLLPQEDSDGGAEWNE